MVENFRGRQHVHNNVKLCESILSRASVSHAGRSFFSSGNACHLNVLRRPASFKQVFDRSSASISPVFHYNGRRREKQALKMRVIFGSGVSHSITKKKRQELQIQALLDEGEDDATNNTYIGLSEDDDDPPPLTIPRWPEKPKLKTKVKKKLSIEVLVPS